ncbi:MAG: CSLREA domain-containing protein, partial [Ardenticatenaceae bacterium]|nr:CSLREA domain-containing protein [Ardenticatenaceae bacterium]
MKRLMILIFMGLILGGLGLMVNHVAAGGSTIVVTTTADVDVNIDGQCSLREAIIAANTNTPSGIVLGECPAGSDTSEDFIVLTSGESYTLAIAGKDEDAGLTGDLDIVDDIDSEILADVVIITDEAGQATIDGAGVDRVLHLLGARVRLDNLVVRGGNPGAASGGGVLNESGHLAVSDSQIILNESSLGGGIASKEGELRLTDVIVRINVATQGGGLGLVGNTAVSLNNSDITLNTANEGGGIYADAANGAITIEGGSVSNNGTASGAGGGLYVASSSPVTIDQTSISENETTSGVEVGHGAGIYMGDAASMLHVRNASIEQNTADAFGGGIFSHGTVVMTRTMVMSNTAVSGGGVHISEGQQITVTSSGFVHNAAMGNAGGGIMAAKASLVASTVSQNSAVVGAGIYADELTATYVEFVNNRADSWGGA